MPALGRECVPEDAGSSRQIAFQVRDMTGVTFRVEPTLRMPNSAAA